MQLPVTAFIKAQCQFKRERLHEESYRIEVCKDKKLKYLKIFKDKNQ